MIHLSETTLDAINHFENAQNNDILKLLDEVYDHFRKNEFKFENMFNTILNLMMIFGKYQSLKGLEKKHAILLIVTDLIDQLPDDRDIAKLVLNNFAGLIIDSFIEVENGKLHFNYKQFDCLQYLLCCPQFNTKKT
jgi:hypothetical protein